MRLSDLGTRDATHARSRAPEHGVDPLPVPRSRLDPLYRAWTRLVVLPVTFLVMGLGLAVAIPLSLVLPVERFQRWGPQQLLGLVPWLALVRVRVRRHPGFDASRPVVACMNHTSLLDAFVAIRALPLRLCGLHHAHHFQVPLYGRIMRMSGGIGVERGASGQLEGVRAQVLDRAARGLSVLAFPEGRRTQNGRILPLRLGVLRIARDAGLPVVPVAVRGLWGVLRRGSSTIRPGRVDVCVGPPVETAGLDDEALAELARRMRAFMAAWVEDGVPLDPRAIDPRTPDPGPGYAARLALHAVADSAESSEGEE